MPLASLGLRDLLFLGAAVALLAGVIVLVAVRILARGTGFRAVLRGAATVVASDTGAGASVLLTDPVLGLRGRPDYLLEETISGGRVLVPLEVKPTRRSLRLYDSDEIQLAAYLLAARATFGSEAAEYGYVNYAAKSFRVELTEDLEGRVRTIVAAIRAGRSSEFVRRTHRVRARCARCALREVCDQALA